MNSSKAKSQNLPEDFLIKMAGLLGEEFDEFQSSLHKPPIISLRINTLKISAQEFLSISPYDLSPLAWCTNGFIVGDSRHSPGIPPPGKHPYHHAGLYYIQEPSAMAVTELLSPLPGEKVLDLAAAPGGKTTHLAAQMQNSGLLVANEIHPRRVWDLADNLERCGVTNSIILNETPQRLAAHFGAFFDRVLLDAPCSGEGMFKKSSTARSDWKAQVPTSCAIRQSNILEYAAQLVKPGGTIAYSTCTFSPEENEGVINTFLSNHPDFDLLPTPRITGFEQARPAWIGLPADSILSQATRIWPHRAPAEGHFIALLIKNINSHVKYVEKGYKPKKVGDRLTVQINPADAWPIFDHFCQESLCLPAKQKRLFIKGTDIYQFPEGSVDIKGLKVIAAGWRLGTIQKNRFIPSHALAMGIQQEHARHERSLSLGEPQLYAYLSGESFPDTGSDGWVLITINGYPLGWGRRTKNIIKNFYPKKLRQPN